MPLQHALDCSVRDGSRLRGGSGVCSGPWGHAVVAIDEHSSRRVIPTYLSLAPSTSTQAPSAPRRERMGEGDANRCWPSGGIMKAGYTWMHGGGGELKVVVVKGCVR